MRRVVTLFKSVAAVTNVDIDKTNKANVSFLLHQCPAEITHLTIICVIVSESAF